jgi:hypothetical protein
MTQNIVKTVRVSGLSDYEKACGISSSVFDNIIKTMTKKDKKGIVKALNVVFTKQLTINSKGTWNPKDKGFDVINITATTANS